MKIKNRTTTPIGIIKEVQSEMNKKSKEKSKDKNNSFDLFIFNKLYKSQIAELTWIKINNLFKVIKSKKITCNWLEFTMPEKEKLKGYADGENRTQSINNPGLATMVKFLMEDKQISQLEEKILFYIYYNFEGVLKQNAKEKIINGNKKILFYFIKRLRFKLEHDEGEMLTEGYMELRNMFDKYDPKTNYKFLSYAQWSIYQVMKKCICKEQNIIQLPLNILNQIYKLNRWLEDGNFNNDDIKIKEYQKENKISNKSMKLILKYRQSFGKTVSLDTKISDDNKNSSFENIVVDDSNNNTLKEEEFRENLKQILNEKEYTIITKLYGLGCEKESKKEICEKDPELNTAKLNTIIKQAINKLKKEKDLLANIID